MNAQPRPLDGILSREVRIQKLREITNFLLQLEKPRGNDANVMSLAERFESQVYSESKTVQEYHSRVHSVLQKVREARMPGNSTAQANQQQQHLTQQQQQALAQKQHQQRQQHLYHTQQQKMLLKQQQAQQQLQAAQELQPPISAHSYQEQLSLASNAPAATAGQYLDPEAKQRVAKIEALRLKYSHHIEDFVKKSSQLLQRAKKSIQEGNAHQSPQLRKLYECFTEGNNTLAYMRRCQQGHVPSAPSLASLEQTLLRVIKAAGTLRNAENSKAAKGLHQHAMQRQHDQRWQQHNHQQQQLQQQQLQQQLHHQQQQQQQQQQQHPQTAPVSVALVDSSFEDFSGTIEGLDDLEPIPLPEDDGFDLGDSFSEGLDTSGVGGGPTTYLPAAAAALPQQQQPQQRFPSAVNVAGPLPSAGNAQNVWQSQQQSQQQWAQQLQQQADTGTKRPNPVSLPSASNAPQSNPHTAGGAGAGAVQAHKKARTETASAAAMAVAMEPIPPPAPSAPVYHQQADNLAAFYPATTSIPVAIEATTPARAAALTGPADSSSTDPNNINALTSRGPTTASPHHTTPNPNPGSDLPPLSFVANTHDTASKPALKPQPRVGTVPEEESSIGGKIKGLISQYVGAGQAVECPIRIGKDLIQEISNEVGSFFELDAIMKGPEDAQYVSRLRATCRGSFHVLINFSYHSNDARQPLRPMDVSVLGFSEFKSLPSLGEGSLSAGPNSSSSEEESNALRLAQAFRGGPAWPASKHELYQKVSAHAFQVLYSAWDQSNHMLAEALIKFLKWIKAYKSIFSDPCSVANKQLSIDVGSGGPLPATGRSKEGAAYFPENGSAPESTTGPLKLQ